MLYTRRIIIFFNFISLYRNIFFKVFFFEIFYSIKFFTLFPKIKFHNSSKRTDTIPCIYYFLHEISKFLKKKGVKSVVDIGSGYGRVVNFISHMNNIKASGVEYDEEAFNYSLKFNNKNTRFYYGDIFNFDLNKFNSKCFILVEPFKQVKDRTKLLNRIKKVYPKHKKYIITINNYEGNFPKFMKLIQCITASKSRDLKIFEIS